MTGEGGMKGTFWRRGRMRVPLVFIAAFALSLLPLRASCHPGPSGAAQATAEHQVWHEHDQSDPCCESVGDSALVDSAAPEFLAGTGVAQVVAPAFPGLTLAGPTDRPPRLAGAPPPSRSYHARSSRILR